MAISISSGYSPNPVPTGGVDTGYGGGFTSGGGLTVGPGQSQSHSEQQSAGQQQSQSYIPDYSQTPILNSIAQYAQNMAPQVYNWGMEQWGKNQGNIDAMMRSALTYASPQRVKNEMGMAEAGVQQGAEAGRQSAIRDLESYGIDPSSGRYQQLDNASRVMAGASAAGAGNQQRMATEAQGNAMQQQALSAGLQNTAMGYGASDAMNKLLSTGMQLKYSPLGTSSSGYTSSSGGTDSASQAFPPSGGSGGGIGNAVNNTLSRQSSFNRQAAEGGPIEDAPLVRDDNATTGGFVSQELSPSAGAQTDDIDARLNAGEFVIPKDVSNWLGQEYFYKLMAKARAARATAGQESGGMGYQEPLPSGAAEAAPTGYVNGGVVRYQRMH